MRCGQLAEFQIVAAIKGCIEERAGPDAAEGRGGSNNHLLDGIHTHIGIGLFVSENRLRYVEVGRAKKIRSKNSFVRSAPTDI